jgi:hypothetical protein
MPRYRYTGTVTVSAYITVEADTEEEARTLAEEYAGSPAILDKLSDPTDRSGWLRKPTAKVTGIEFRGER